MNYLKKFAVGIAAIIAAANSLGYMPYNPIELPAFTAEAADIVASGECGAEGDNVKWQLDSEGTLTISGEGEMKGWKIVSDIPWYDDYKESIKKIIIENGVTHIGENICSYLSELESIELSESVKSIDENQFNSTPKLKSICVDSNSTFYSDIDGILFDKDKTTIVEYPSGIDNNNYSIPVTVKTIGVKAFDINQYLTEISIPDSVTRISDGAFQNCRELKTVTLPDSLEIIDFRAFMGCMKLASIDIPDSVNVINDFAFYACTNLSSVTLSNCLTDIAFSSFGNCSSLASITIPESVKALENGVFSNCSNLTSIIIPKNVESIGDNCFEKCAGLNSITIENPECEIYDDEYTISDTAEIRGYANSTAQAYAEKYNRKFVVLEGKPATEIVASGECGAEGDNVKWQLDSEGTLTISGEGEMKRFSYSSPAPWKSENFKKLIIENGVTSILKEAFADCSSLTSVTIADSVTTIGEAAFKNCSSLTLVNIPEGVTAIKSLTFEGCSELTSIVIPDSVTSIESAAFRDCSNLKDISIPDSVTTIGGASFARTPWLETKKSENPYVIVNNILIDGTACKGDITIPDNVVCIADYAFQANSELISVIIPDSITNIGNSIFSYCSNLTSVTIPNSITTIPGATFEYCQKLNAITLPDSIKVIETNAFFNCSELNSITIENSECVIEDSEKTICNTYDISTKETGFKGTIYGYPNSTAQAYAEKYSRKFVALDEKTAAEIVASGECGEEGYDLTWSLDSTGTLTISGSGEMDSWALNSPWSEYSSEITKVIISEGVTTIGEQAFNDCKKLKDVSISDSVTNIKTGAFFDCTGLTSIKIPESVTEMGHSVFYGCVNLKEVTLPSGIETINTGVFRDCQSLETITFSKNVKKVDFTALCGCSNLKSVIFEHPGCKIADAEHTICNSHDFDTEENVFNGTIYGYENSTAQAYAEKYNRTFVALEGKPAIEIIDSGECGVMEEDGVFWMFDSEGTLTISGAGGSMYFHDDNIPWGKYQKDIVKVVVEKGVTGIEVAAFSYCTNLKSVTISSDVMYIGPYAFSGCTSLESIVIPDGVTDIEYSTFKDCKNLTSITLPESIIEIGHSAFEGCEKLASITLKNPECVIDDVENTIPDTTVIYGCKNSEVQAYAEKYNIKFVVLDEKPAAAELGDVNSDGKVDSSDASLVLEEYAAIQTGGAGKFTENQQKVADVNKDGKTDSSDASKILEYYAMISTGKEPTWD